MAICEMLSLSNKSANCSGSKYFIVSIEIFGGVYLEVSLDIVDRLKVINLGVYQRKENN